MNTVNPRGSPVVWHQFKQFFIGGLAIFDWWFDRLVIWNLLVTATFFVRVQRYAGAKSHLLASMLDW